MCRSLVVTDAGLKALRDACDFQFGSPSTLASRQYPARGSAASVDPNRRRGWSLLPLVLLGLALAFGLGMAAVVIMSIGAPG